MQIARSIVNGPKGNIIRF